MLIVEKPKLGLLLVHRKHASSGNLNQQSSAQQIGDEPQTDVLRKCHFKGLQKACVVGEDGCRLADQLQVESQRSSRTPDYIGVHNSGL